MISKRHTSATRALFGRKTATWLFVPLVALSLGTACTPRIQTHGNALTQDDIKKIEIGQHSQEDVANLLGSPTSVASFEPETWYYISERTESLAFMEPEVTERNVTAIRFDDQGIVSAVEKTGSEDARDISPVERTTPTAGTGLGFFEQLISNIGRFNKK